MILSPEQTTVTFEDIKFGYVPERPILNGLSFRAPAGKKIAIVGGSGSGLVICSDYYINNYLFYVL